MNIENLILRREYFPIQTYQFWQLGRIEIPPYHPSMETSGIPFEIAPSIIGKSLADSITDLKKIANKTPGINNLYGATLDLKLREPFYENKEVRDSGITLEGLPIFERVFVGRKNINPYGLNGDQGITIDPELSPSYFSVPKNVRFSKELMREYEMIDEGIFLDEREIKCDNLWYRHNLEKFNAIFYRNIVIALNNEITKQKYSKIEEQR